jgi:hypothetical protein
MDLVDTGTKIRCLHNFIDRLGKDSELGLGNELRNMLLFPFFFSVRL